MQNILKIKLMRTIASILMLTLSFQMVLGQAVELNSVSHRYIDSWYDFESSHPDFVKVDKNKNKINPWHDAPVHIPFENLDVTEATPVSLPELRSVGDSLLNFDGIAYGNHPENLFPPDPVGAANGTYYLQGVNNSLALFDYSGNLVGGPIGLSGFFDLTVIGDVMVAYDIEADRWIVLTIRTLFPSGSIVMAVSNSSDPFGGWNQWVFNGASLPDYPKIAIRPDGYYITVRLDDSDVYILNRDDLLAGVSSPRGQRLNLPSINDSDGEDGSLVITGDGQVPGSPATAAAFRRNGCAGGQYCDLRLWEIDVDWATPSSTTVTTTTLAVNPVPKALSFYSDMPSGWFNFIYPQSAHYQNFGTHQSFLMHQATNLSSGSIGIRWVEVRDNFDGAGWQIYQQGVYGDNDQHRFYQDMSFDENGNIALGYCAAERGSGLTSVRSTGRLELDPLGQMTLDEVTWASGGTGTDGRYGDFTGMAIDAVDKSRIWYTSQYNVPSGGFDPEWKTRIVSFRLESAGSTPDSEIGSTDLSSTARRSNDDVEFNVWGQGQQANLFMKLPNGQYQLILRDLSGKIILADQVQVEGQAVYALGQQSQDLGAGVYLLSAQSDDFFVSTKYSLTR